MSGMEVRSTSPAQAHATRRPSGDPDLGLLYRNQAIILSLEGRFVESEAFSRQALELRPDDVDVLNELAVAVWHQDRLEEAEEICRRASRKIGDWRWLNVREDSLWYPALRLFRQRRLGDWESVFRRMAECLRPELEGRDDSRSHEAA